PVAQDHILGLGQLLKYYERFPGIIKTTMKLMADCTINFDDNSNKNKKNYTGSAGDDIMLLEKLALEGLEYRYGKNNKEAHARVAHELEIINRLGYCCYFLTTWNIVNYGINKGYYHVGRGSGANSIVAYCLRITDVCPIELGLYFERFINPKRTSPPDFDIDFSWKDRDDILRYIFNRFGREHTALLGTIVTFKGKSIVRELGKVYGLPKRIIDDLIENPNGEFAHDPIAKNIFYYGKQLANFPNMRSIHAGGVLISEKPLTTYTAMDMPPKGFPTTQIDMFTAQELGFAKLDILSQRGIGHINDAAKMILDNHGVDLDIHDVDRYKNDPKVQQQLNSGKTLGCFYVESPAMRGLLKKLDCNTYLDLVAASSIIRPGVAKSGMMHKYIERYNSAEPLEYLHPIMKEQLEDTFGVMVYQEDMIKICHYFAGLEPADADVLRRSLSGKSRSKKELQRVAAMYFDNCKALGYADELTNEVWRQIASFSGYSFSKAHSASYGVESFQSLYLKAHYPLEFMVSVINNFGGFYDTWVYIHEAAKCGGKIQMPDVNKSEHLTMLEKKDIYLGFVHLLNLDSRVSKLIVAAREMDGKYRSLQDFVKRVPAGINQLLLLIRADAFRFTGKHKKELMLDAHVLLGVTEKLLGRRLLFEESRAVFESPRLRSFKYEDVYDEIELLGFPVSMQAHDLLKTNFRGNVQSDDMVDSIGKRVKMVGNLVTIKYVTTVRKDLMNFTTFLDSKGEFFDCIHFPRQLKEYPFKGKGMYLLEGLITEDFGFPSLEVSKMVRLPLVRDPRYRD
ncbi:MAG: DNA polymerase III subunit alpha, partial [Bacteroidetes bacterium]|nr:DNA polymerase III subunit alpha [Bacteroidota bacterium]